MKLVVDRQTDRVLGCHMIGSDAAEIIQGFAVALQCGATKTQFDATIGIHPTAAEEFVTMRTKAFRTDIVPRLPVFLSAGPTGLAGCVFSPSFQVMVGRFLKPRRKCTWREY